VASALPNLIVIGAKKAATTSLHSYLDAHPDISMSREKELDFFVAERNWRRGPRWYGRQFDAAAAVRGESSPYYTALPHHAGVPERMAEVVPAARLVYAVRDPIERLLSHYRMGLATGRERRPLEAAIADPDSWYLAQGRYWMQLEPYLRHFGAEQILVVDQHELGRNRSAELRRVFEFLGVDLEFNSPEFDDVHYPAPTRRRRRPVAKAIRALDRMIGAERSYQARRRAPGWLWRMLTVPLEPPVLRPELRARMERLYEPEVTQLREHTGLRFASWSV
jgi:hypothetical protein